MGIFNALKVKAMDTNKLKEAQSKLAAAESYLDEVKAEFNKAVKAELDVMQDVKVLKNGKWLDLIIVDLGDEEQEHVKVLNPKTQKEYTLTAAVIVQSLLHAHGGERDG